MPASQQWKSDGAKTSTSTPFEVELNTKKTTYTLKTEANIKNGELSASKLTLQDTVSGGTGTTPRALATSTDGGKTWIPEKDSEEKSIINSGSTCCSISWW
jgi:chitodextrinase